MEVFLPEDVILNQIITWVPTKSAVRFKCVSKQWNSFIKSDRFKEIHNDCSLLKDYVCPYLKDQNIFFLSEEKFYTVDSESPPCNAPCRRSLPDFVERTDEYTAPQHMCVLTSDHGLVCLLVEKNVHKRQKHVPRDYDFILWNPVTTEYKRLSRPSNPDHMECYDNSGYGLYYSSDEDDYKLLAVTESGNVYIYSLKSDSWRKLDTEFIFQGMWTWRPGFCLGNHLYFLSQSKRTEGSMRFDTKAMTFHEIKTPPVSRNMDETSIAVQKGSIHFCAMYGYICIELWKYIADEDIWSKVVNYQLLGNFDIRGLSPLHLMSNGNMLMIDYRGGGNRICQVDLIKKKDDKSKCEDESEGDDNDKYKVLYNSDFTVGYPAEVIYTATFVSPNHYMRDAKVERCEVSDKGKV